MCLSFRAVAIPLALGNGEFTLRGKEGTYRKGMGHLA